MVVEKQACLKISYKFLLAFCFDRLLDERKNLFILVKIYSRKNIRP